LIGKARGMREAEISWAAVDLTQLAAAPKIDRLKRAGVAHW
jgi:hypothetical protein